MLTLAEVGELSADNQTWWPKMCEGVAEQGIRALTKEAKKRGWSWGAVWGWIVSDEKRYADYQKALEAHAQLLAVETVEISDEQCEVLKETGDPYDPDVQRDNLRIKARQWVISKMDRQRWGDKVEHEHRGVPVLIIETGEKVVVGEQVGP